METAVIVALISAGATIFAVILQGKATTTKVMTELEKHQAVTDVKIEELTRETRKHNNFGERIPVIEEQIKVANHRIDDLERKVE